jgi:RND family efflux transporter MFP subunit
MKKIIKTASVIVILAASILLTAFVLKRNKINNEKTTAIVAQVNASVAVKTDFVLKQTPDLSFLANGNFEPFQEMTFPAENSGRIISVLVDEGSNVSRGQTLATIKTDQIVVDMQNSNAAYQNALVDMQRYEAAFKTGGVTQQQLDMAKLKVDNTLAQVKQSQISMGNANIKASISGIINKRYIEPGSVVSPGASLFDIVNVSTLKLKVAVNEAQVTGLQVGQTVKVTSSVFPNKQFTGKITFIAPKADNALNFPVEIQIANTVKNEIKAGMYGTAIFTGGRTQTMLLVPRTAFVGSVNNNRVFTIDGNNIAHLKTIMPGRILGDKVEILSGLVEGERVIISGQINLNDGTLVQAIQ